MDTGSRIIVIGRQFGSGGGSLGKELASRLSIPYYDKEILAEAADSLGFDRRIFDRADERRPSFLRTALSLAYGSAHSDISPSGLSKEKIYEIQSKVIKELALAGDCVIVGRTADYVLRHFPRLLSIFVHAPEALRAARIVSRGDAASTAEATEKARKIDRIREGYYNYFTGRRWGKADNYHLCLDSSRLALEAMADVALCFLNNMARVNEYGQQPCNYEPITLHNPFIDKTRL